MSTVKISQLPVITTLSANNSNTLFVAVNLDTGTTGQFSTTTLSQVLFANNVLNVGTSIPSNYSGLIAQFIANNSVYGQTNYQNMNPTGSMDIVVTADLGTDANGFIDLGINNSQFNGGQQYSSMHPIDGYLYVHGLTDNSNNGNLIIGTASSGANVLFVVGNTTAQNIVATLTKSGLVLNTQSSIIFSDNTQQATAAASKAYSQAGFAQANLAYTVANTANNLVNYQSGVDATQNTNTQLAWNKANNALANTTGTFAGDLTLTGNLIAGGIQSTSGPITTGNLIVNGTGNITGTLNVSGIVSMNALAVLSNISFTSTQAALTIASTPTVATPSQDGYMIHVSGKQNTASRIITDSFGANANTYVVYAGRAARGNVTNPSAVQSGDILTRFAGNGYGTTKYQPFGTARIDFVAGENYTDAATGSQIQFWNCSVGSNTVTQIAVFNGTSATFTGTVQPQKGFIYTPTVYPGAQTSITIDFANSSVVRAQTSSGITVTLSNLLAGKEVVVWITNTAGTNQTFTHGLSATNSTLNATNYAIPGTSTILARYMCIDGTAQNTFVAVTHA